jgi:uncharacterized protein (TIGR02284 family)
MSLLLSELQTALNDVVVACLEAVDGHEAAAGMLADDHLAGMLHDLARARRAAADELGEVVRALGDLPPAPDADLEVARELATRVKAALSPDQRLTVMQERAAAEARLAACTAQALARADLPETARAALQDLAASSQQARDRLARGAPG